MNMILNFHGLKSGMGVLLLCRDVKQDATNTNGDTFGAERNPLKAARLDISCCAGMAGLGPNIDRHQRMLLEHLFIVLF